MAWLGSAARTQHTLTEYRSNVAIKKSDVKKQSISEAAVASTTDWVVTPEITINANAQDETDRQNTSCLAAIGIKESIAAKITVIVGDHITNPILRTIDGADFRTFDQYAIHQLISAVTNGAKQPLATAIR